MSMKVFGTDRKLIILDINSSSWVITQPVMFAG
jgi:hypothetical protein